MLSAFIHRYYYVFRGFFYLTAEVMMIIRHYNFSACSTVIFYIILRSYKKRGSELEPLWLFDMM